MNEDLIAQVADYHEATKHHYNRFARAPGYLDWANQPDPFRRYSGASLIHLPIIVRDESLPYRKLFGPESIPSSPVTPESLSRFLELSLSVSAWKQSGDSRWALRSNPSSGNLHPTEGYLMTDGMDELHPGPGVYHYVPGEHGLELRAEIPGPVWQKLMASFPRGSFLAGLTSIHWREAWKYGERAFRYCQHDIGHALAALRVAAAVLGWNLVLLEEVDDASLSRLLGLDREKDFIDAEREHPDWIAIVFPNSSAEEIPLGLDVESIGKIATGRWRGKANRLSEECIPWERIDSVSRATLKPTGNPGRKRSAGTHAPQWKIDPGTSLRRKRTTARQIIRQRRSAVALDGVTSISSEEFYTILLHTVCRNGSGMPWDAVSWSPRIHLCLFVHRVRGLAPGLYFLVRDLAKLEAVRQQTRKEFAWRKPGDCPPELSLYLLKEGNFQNLAAQVSCTQDIAGQGAFSLGMISEFLPSLEKIGPWFYRRLFWESGMVGQMLYLAAEFMGVRGTGIGCYFDDPVHEILGLKDQTFQSLYHFTLGGHVEDDRLTTHPAYGWSCEIPDGQFTSRYGCSSVTETAARVLELPSRSIVTWKGRKLSRIGAGLARFSQVPPEHQHALSEILKSPLNVIETTAEGRAEEQERLLGQTLNDFVEKEGGGLEGVVFIRQVGVLQGRAGTLVDEMRRRGVPFKNLVSQGGRSMGLDPDFLKDQLDRSRHRLGLEILDLVLLRIPDELPGVWGEAPCLGRIRDAALFLQNECERGKIGGFGISPGRWGASPLESPALSLEKIYETLDGLSGFSAVAFHANFLEKEPFLANNSRPGLVDLAREKGLLVISGSPLVSENPGHPVLLVDFLGAGQEDAAVWGKSILKMLLNREKEIHATPLADGRTLGEALRAANLPSPFQLQSMGKSFFGSRPESPAALQEVTEAFHTTLYHSRYLGKQLVHAGLWKPADADDVVQSLESLFGSIRQNYKQRMRRNSSGDVARLRKEQFAGAPPSVPLQFLGIQWLLDHGVDVVLNGMTHPNYVREAVICLKNTQ